MTLQEFNDRTKLDASSAEFNKIHDMYMAAGDDIDKDVFCREYRAHSESILLQRFYKDSISFREQRDKARGFIDDLVDFLVDQVHECSSPVLRQKAIDILGIQEFLKRKIERGHQLWQVDKDALTEILAGHAKKHNELY